MTLPTFAGNGGVAGEPKIKVYRGARDTNYDANGVRGHCNVFVDSVPLKPSSAGGFEWGYRGTNPTMLASSILEDYFGHNEIPRWYIIAFREKFVRHFKFEGWKLDENEIDRWVDMMEQKYKKEHGDRGKEIKNEIE